MNRSHCRIAVFAAAILLTLILNGCTSGVSGTYSDQTGNWTLELKSGGAATFTAMGVTGPCTYTSASKQINLSCPGQAGVVTFTVRDDGSLTAPPGSVVPALRKTK